MRTQFKVAPHIITTGDVVEVWYDGKLIGAVYAQLDRAGVRVVSKHPMRVDGQAMTIEVEIMPGKG